jgi:hypothetical protein
MLRGGKRPLLRHGARQSVRACPVPGDDRPARAMRDAERSWI